jgi:hypothetical protein
MDDPQFVEAARVLAEKALTSSPQNVDVAFDYLSYRLLSRSFNDKERAVVKSSYKDYLSYYDSTPADAKKLIAVGESKAPTNLAAPELAAMTMVANEVMNLDEVLVN